MFFFLLHVDGVKIYRKTLRGGRKEKSELVQEKIRIRSRQQRVRYTAIVEIFGGLKLRISISDRI